MARLFYVYGIVPATTTPSGAPPGVDDAQVAVVTEGDLGALTSELTGDSYHPQTIAELSGDMNWVAPRATAHDLVLTWASDRGPVIPMPMFASTFASAESLRQMLRELSGELTGVLKKVASGREYS